MDRSPQQRCVPRFCNSEKILSLSPSEMLPWNWNMATIELRSASFLYGVSLRSLSTTYWTNSVSRFADRSEAKISREAGQGMCIDSEQHCGDLTFGLCIFSRSNVPAFWPYWLKFAENPNWLRVFQFASMTNYSVQDRAKSPHAYRIFLWWRFR